MCKNLKRLMETLKNLEKELDFSYPPLYHKLYSDGMLKPCVVNEGTTIGEFELGTNASLSAKLKNQHGTIPFLSAISTIRVLPVEQIRYRLTESYIGENIDRAHMLIPFAVDSAGAWFAFSFKLQQNNDVSIAIVWDDCDEATVVAKSLEDFIALRLLEAAALFYSDEPLEQRRKELQEMLVTHTPYMNPHHVKLLIEVYKRAFFSTFHQASKHYSYTSWHLIGKDELTALTKELLSFKLMGKTFRWLREES